MMASSLLAFRPHGATAAAAARWTRRHLLLGTFLCDLHPLLDLLFIIFNKN